MSSELFLWDHPVSPFAQKVRIGLREKNIPFRFETPKGGGSGNLTILDPNFVSSNVRVQVPTLIDGDMKMFESTIILEYLEDKFPQTPLHTVDAAGRAKARMIEDVCDSQYEAINWGMGEIETFKRADGELAGRLKEQARHQVKQIQRWLMEQLGNSEWFGGNKFGYADVCVWPFVNRSTSYGLEPDPESSLGRWYERAKKRPSVASVFEEFTVGLNGVAAAYAFLQKGLIRREYRDHRLEWMIKSGGINIVKDGLENNNIRFSWPEPLK